MFRLLVAGGRDFYDYRFVDEVLTEWLSEQDINSEEITLVHGDAAGVDRIAAQWARYNNFVLEPHPAKWKDGMGRYDPNAGPKRNLEMIESGVDHAILFPGGKGTLNMKTALRLNSIKFQEVFDDIIY